MGLIRVKYGFPKTGFSELCQSMVWVREIMNLVRLNTAKIWVFGIFRVQTLKLLSKMKEKTIFDWCLMILFIFADTFVWLFEILAIQNQVSSQWNKATMFQICMFSVCFAVKKLTTRDWLWSQLMLSDMFQEHRVLSCENCQPKPAGWKYNQHEGYWEG